HCFGCGKGGNAFTFMMEHENMTFVEAIRYLAQKSNIIIPEKKEDRFSKEELERLHYAHQVALDYFRSLLKAGQYREQVMKYLKNTRHLTDKTITQFQLGVAGEEWDGLLKYALKKELFPKDLEKAGLVIHSDKEDKYFDRFRQRLMIPIFNLSDKPIAFGGRTLRKGDPAKYMNSPETLLYSKSNVLYGLNLSRQSIREKNEVIIVEGYFDFISLYQAGITNVVASSGTAFTAQQARLLARFSDMTYLFFDADSAGQTAAGRSVDALYDAGMEVMVMLPPEGEDPDSVAVKSGAKGIEEIKFKALKYLEFRTKNMDSKKGGIIAKEKLVKELAELAGRIADGTRRQIFIDEASALIPIDAKYFYGLLPGTNMKPRPTSEIPPPKKIIDIERDLLSLIVSFPEHIDMVREKIVFEDFQEVNLGKIYSLILTVYKIQGTVSEGILIDMVDDKSLTAEISSLVRINWDNHSITVTIKDYVRKILSFKYERIIDRLKGELKLAEEKGDTETSKKLTKEITDLISRR
ncbi:MAG: DNA primase, partial [candidate division Zixibacteria bacterium]|nr:DNA primase [candidate division Zixibacteria bacterium]